MTRSKIVYRAAEGSGFLRSDEEAKEAGEFLNRTFRDTPFKSVDVVRVAEPEDSPIHKHFDWDNTTAAASWRQSQAAHLVRSIVVIEQHGDKEIESRGFHYVTFTNGQADRKFVNQRMVWKDPHLSIQVVSEALRELRSWKRRYETYKELSSAVIDVQSLIDRMEDAA